MPMCASTVGTVLPALGAIDVESRRLGPGDSAISGTHRPALRRADLETGWAAAVDKT
jgi:hypothetical protein